jgi:hypothetical protein
MKGRSVRMMAAALVVWTLVMPHGLAAGGRRGANLVITRLDGTRVSGELVAVKSESLLLLTYNAAGASVDLSDIKSVRIMRRSRAGLFAGIAGAAGLAGGTLWCLSEFRGEEDQAALSVIGGLCLGAVGALSGLLVGGAQGIDSNFTVVGEREEILAGYWKKLAALSREGRLPEPPGTPAAGLKAAKRSARPARGPRFKLGLGMSADSLGTMSRESEGSFRFPGEAPPELGPYPAAFSQSRYHFNHPFRLTSFCLGYEWTAQVTAEAEYFVLGRVESFTMGSLEFTSSFDGRSFRGVGNALIDARFSGLLVGLALRPYAPSAFERHIVEIGAAIGPAFARGTVRLFPFEGSGTQTVRKAVFAGRIRAAYDFYPIPTLSVGAVVDWRFVQTDLSGLTAQGNANFVDVEDTALSFLRLTEVAFPPLAVKATGFYWGLRIGVRI